MTTKLSAELDEAIFDEASIVPAAKIFKRLKQSNVWKLYRRVFQTTTGMPLFLEPVGSGEAGSRAPDRNTGFCNSFCRLMNDGRTPVCAQCPLSGVDPEDSRDESTLMSGYCKAGLQEESIAVRFQNRSVARLWTGSVSLSRPTIETFSTRASRVWMVCPAAKIREAAELWLLSPAITREQLDLYRTILRAFADQLGLRINRALIEDDPRDPDWMRAVKESEREGTCQDGHRNQWQEISEWESAFGVAGGMSYGEYAERCRLDRAFNLLLDPNRSTENVARASGFESCEAFRRSSLKLIGDSPDSLRERVLESERALTRIPLLPDRMAGIGRSLSLQ